jgi:superfamily II DNA or RNA helicase
MEIEVDNLTSRLKTDNPKILEAFNKKYAFYAPGYAYTPQYKKKVWDGKIRYFKKDGTFKTGLLPRIKDDLREIGVDLRDLVISGEPKITDPFDLDIKNVKNFEYRDYQTEAIQAILDEKRCILESPVASGKTLIMAGVIASLAPRKMVILFNRKQLLHQTFKFFKTCGIKNLGINSGDGYEHGEVMLSMIQSIERIIDTHLLESEVLMVDEAHEFCKGETTVAAIESFPNAIWRVAFTATPPSEKGDINGRMVLEGAFGSVISTKSADDLIKEGALAKPIIQIVQYAPSGVNPDIDYRAAYNEHIVNGFDRNELIHLIVCKLVASRSSSKTLILVKDLQHLKNLELLFKTIKVADCYTIEGKDDIEERYELINKFIKDTGHSIIIGTNVMQTGVNINEITHMINARGLEGEIPTIQGLGRGLRKAEGKTELYFYDFYDKVPYLEQHSKKRIKHYEGLNFEIHYAKL